VGAKRENQHFRGERFPTEGGQEYPDIRLKDMDEEGVDVQVMVPYFSLTKDFGGSVDNEILMEFIAATHRHLNDMCNVAPHRLRSLLLVSPIDIEQSVNEINKWGPSSWSAGIQPQLPIDYPIDHPDMYPIWKAAQAHNLPLIHHSLNTGLPGISGSLAESFPRSCRITSMGGDALPWSGHGIGDSRQIPRTALWDP